MSFKRVAPLLLALSGLVFAGAGCLSFGTTTQPPPPDNGGMLRTVDGAVTWSKLAAVPTATGVGSLASENIMALTADPQDSLTLYAGTYADGLFYTIDGGVTWARPRNDNLRTGSVVAVAVDPKNVCTVYAAKGQHLYKTNDCLRDFSPDVFVETRANVIITGLAVDWYTPSTLWLSESNGDLQESTDSGTTWHRSLSVSSPINSLTVSKTDSRVVLVGTGGTGFFRTGDSGITWTQIDSQLNNMRGAATVFSVAQDSKGVTLVAATQYGLIRSQDDGASWQPLTLLTAPGQVTIDALAVGPISPNVIAYATASTFYRSTDGGSTWDTHQLPSSRPPTHLIGDTTNPLTYTLSFGAAPQQ